MLGEELELGVRMIRVCINKKVVKEGKKKKENRVNRAKRDKEVCGIFKLPVNVFMMLHSQPQKKSANS